MSSAAASSEVNTSLVEKFEEFYQRYYGTNSIRDARIAELAQHYPNDETALVIDWPDLYAYDHKLAEDLLDHPGEVIPAAEEALRHHDLPINMDGWHPEVQFEGVDEMHAREIGSFGMDEQDSIRLVTGQVTRKTIRRPQVGGTAVFVCQRCGADTEVPQGEGSTELQNPYECTSCERQGPFKLSFPRSDMQIHQMIRVQTPPEKASGDGNESIDIRLHDALTNEVEIGERVNVVARIQVQQEDDDSALCEWDVEAYGIERLETDWDELDVDEHIEDIREIANSENHVERIVSSILPGHYGHDHVKLALALQMFGGVRKEVGDGDPTRGDINMLLIGDPSTGKTQFLSYACDLSPRSIFTSGKSSSAAGLTAACVPDDFGGDGYTIKGGVMVQANNGVAGIDELDKMDETDQTSLMEAMSRQTVSVSKAGIQATLPARTRVTAAANPVNGRFDPYSPVDQQFDFHDALMSRFDLVYTFNDDPDEDRDDAVAEHVLQSAQAASKRQQGMELSKDEEALLEPEIPMDTLRAYIAYAREEFDPVISDEAVDRLKKFYLDIRDRVDEDEDRVPIALRKLEGLVRLSEAAARMRLSNRVEGQDAELAIRAVHKMMEDIGMDPETGKFDADVVETGKSRSQHERVADIKAMVKQLEADEENTHGAPLEELYALASGKKEYTRKKVEQTVKHLKSKGEVYECNGGDCLRMT